MLYGAFHLKFRHNCGTRRSPVTWCVNLTISFHSAYPKKRRAAVYRNGQVLLRQSPPIRVALEMEFGRRRVKDGDYIDPKIDLSTLVLTNDFTLQENTPLGIQSMATANRSMHQSIVMVPLSANWERFTLKMSSVKELYIMKSANDFGISTIPADLFIHLGTFQSKEYLLGIIFTATPVGQPVLLLVCFIDSAA